MRSKTPDKRFLLIDPHRLRAVLALRRCSIEGFARSLTKPVTYRHLADVFAARRTPSSELYDGIREAVGPSEWPFVVGESDVLVAPPIKVKEVDATTARGEFTENQAAQKIGEF